MTDATNAPDAQPVPRAPDAPDAAAYETVRYTQPDPAIVRVLLNRPQRANAQNMQMLYELNAALDRAAADDAVRVIIVAAEGRHFSAGHDLSGEADWSPAEVGISTWGGFAQPGMEGHWAREEEAYFGLCWRWRNIPKPTIAEVQGKVIAGGLMLVWPFDIVVASDDATFQDPVVAFGVNGVEYFGHPWEFGVRQAKELLFTGRAITARLARRLGMVNRVVPRAAGRRDPGAGPRDRGPADDGAEDRQGGGQPDAEPARSVRLAAQRDGAAAAGPCAQPGAARQAGGPGRRRAGAHAGAEAAAGRVKPVRRAAAVSGRPVGPGHGANRSAQAG